MNVLARRALVTGGVGLAGFLLVYALSIWTTLGQRAETRFMSALERPDRATPLLHLVSVPNLGLACLAIVGVGLLRRRWVTAAAGLGVMVAGNVLGQLLKYQVLERPALIGEEANTFPSGHTIAFASTAMALLIVLPPWTRVIAAPVLAVVVSLAGSQLVHFGWHRPGDVIGGVLLLVAVSALACAVPRATEPLPAGIARRTTLGLGLAMFTLGGLVLTASGCMVLARRLAAGAPEGAAETVGYGLVSSSVLLALGALLWVLSAPAAAPLSSSQPASRAAEPSP